MKGHQSQWVILVERALHLSPPEVCKLKWPPGPLGKYFWACSVLGEQKVEADFQVRCGGTCLYLIVEVGAQGHPGLHETLLEGGWADDSWICPSLLIQSTE